MIEVQALTKCFTRARKALDDVSFEVKPAEIVGVPGHSVQRHRATALRQIGAIFESPAFYEYMTGWQNLRALCALSGWWEEAEVKRVLELVHLSDRVHSKVRTYSHGMRQRLALAQALLPMPQVLLLDEPTNGLDPEGIHEFRSTVLKLRDEHGLTILFNSHLLSEVEQMCDRCVILREGRKVYEGMLKREDLEKPRYRLQSTD